MSKNLVATHNQGETVSMKPSLRLVSALLALSTLVPHLANAGVAQPSGIANVVISPNRTEFVGMPFARPVEAYGTISAVTTSSGNDTFTVALDAGETMPALGSGTSNTDAWYVFEILDGPAIGFLLPCTANSGSTSVTVEGSIGNLSPAGSRFAIRKDWTLATLFGAAGINNVFGYGNSSSAGTIKGWVQIYDSATASSTTYYVNESGTTTKSYNWRSISGPSNRNHARINLGRGFVLVNRTATNLTVPISGEYRIARTRLSLLGNKFTYVANPGPTDVTFTDSTIPETSPTRFNTHTGGVDTSDQYGLWNSSNRAWTTYNIGGVTSSNGPSAYVGVSRANPTIPAFRALRVKPAGTNPTVITIAPAL